MSEYELLLIEIRKDFPKFSLKDKASSTFMKLLDLCLKLITFWRMKTFMSKFTTTIGYTVYTPASWEGMSTKVRCLILKHEAVHMQQRKDHGSFWFSFSYLLLPFPVLWAYYRMKYEMEAYEVTVQVKWEYFGRRGFTPQAREAMIKRFTGPSYFWTWPWRKRIETWYDELVSRFVDV
jgi:hypothetical protein